jgi:DNA topoisomerase-1
MKLIITEKDDAARRIAAILSEDSFSSSQRGGVNVYAWGPTRCVGLSGHVVEVDYPPEYDNWRDVRPVELIDAPTTKRPTRSNIVGTLRSLAREADSAIVATDFDREGELIGKEAYDLVRAVSEIPIQRVRFSSITERAVTEAFAEPEELDFALAAAGEARQIIDLMWGASLTRYLSLASGQRGEDFISVGRVQSPTLKLIVEREREIEAFEPEAYWELTATLAPTAEAEGFEAQYFYDDDGREAERIWDAEAAMTATEALEAASSATVTEVRRRTRTDDPPAPFSTTQFISAASSVGQSAQKAMSIAEELYTAGYISYPRTDNTVYPEDLDPEALLETFADSGAFGEDATWLLSADEIEPTRGETETTDHPPIHPTGELPARQDLSEAEWALYELVVRRFFATCAGSAEWAHLRVVATAEERSLKANGKRLLEAGYHRVYPYLSTDEHHIPAVTEGEELALSAVERAAKETQPPRRRGQSRLIEQMEQLGIGTKSTRHNTLEKLYARDYISNDPPRPTQLAMAVADTAERFADRIIDEAMTAQLEADMDAIAAGEETLESVTEESREMLAEIFDSLHEAREAVGDHLREGLKADKTVGPCPDCGRMMLVRQSNRGSYFLGCDGYPDCDATLPLPANGRPTPTDTVCEDHEMAHVRMLDGRSTHVHGCPRCQVERADATEDILIGHCPDCGAAPASTSQDPTETPADEGGLAIKRTRAGGRLAGCTRYPECEYSLPLPRRGELEVLEARCERHHLPEVHVMQEDAEEPWELGCPICNFEEYQAQQTASTIEDLDGIGAKTAAKLAAAGIDSLAKLADADAESLAVEVQGVSSERIRDWQTKAREAIGQDEDEQDPDGDGQTEPADADEPDLLAEIENDMESLEAD